MKTTRTFSPLLTVVLAACGGASTPPTVTPPAAAAPAAVAPALPPPPPAPLLRLGHDVVPERYAVDLAVVPTADTFEGTVDIDVTVATATTGIWLNGAELEVKEALITFDGKTGPARVLPSTGPEDTHLGLATDRLIGPGPAHLRIRYTGKLQARETQGVFKQKSGDDWYVFTQFESTDARRAFPCFDDPSFKTPWTLTLRVPRDLVAAANTPIASETVTGDTRVVQFAASRPLPSYLVAFAVGPFEIVDGGRARSGTPVRVFTFRGRGAEAAYAADSTRQILDVLEDYFGMPYPFEKLDQIPIPKTVGFGAMENPGLVTYVEGLLLVKNGEDTRERKEHFAGTCAHELAHMWFGDLVTLAWWNDTWLNESFADWMELKAVATWQPGWEEDLDRVASRSRSLDADTLTTARAVRQPIESESDIESAFDFITYGKGSAVLAMFEGFLGEATFRAGVQAYLTRHAYGSATAVDFFAAISAAAGRDVAPMMSTFIDQAGEPIVTAALVCAKGQPPKITLEQRRNVLPGEENDARLWQIPLCVRTGTGSAEGRACTLLAEKTGSIELTGACPDWIYPNAGAAGYYRSTLGGGQLGAVLAHRDHLTLAEQVGLAGDLGALVRNATVPAGDALAALATLDPARHHSLASQAASLLRQVRLHMLPEGLRPAFTRYVQRLFGARARALGWVPRAGEPEADHQLRQIVVPLVAGEGDDAPLRAQAKTLALRWLDDRTAIHPDLVAQVLSTAARAGDRAFFDRLRAALDHTAEPADRQRILTALGAFRDAALLRAALDLTLDPSFDIREATRVFYGPVFRGESRPEVYAWVKEHHDVLAERVPRPVRASLLRFGATLCDQAGLADYQAFFEKRAGQAVGGPRIFKSTVEAIKSCIAVRRAQTPSVTAFLGKKAS